MKRGHMNFDDITRLVNGRPGIRFGRVAWGADKWLEYQTDQYNCWTQLHLCWPARSKRGSHVTQHDREARDWYVMQSQDGRIPKL